MNIFSIVSIGNRFPRRTSYRCCAKEVLIVAVETALKMVVRRIKTAETCDCVR